MRSQERAYSESLSATTLYADRCKREGKQLFGEVTMCTRVHLFNLERTVYSRASTFEWPIYYLPTTGNVPHDVMPRKVEVQTYNVQSLLYCNVQGNMHVLAPNLPRRCNIKMKQLVMVSHGPRQAG